MGTVRDAFVDRIWRGKDPFANFPRNLFEVDMQGWGNTHHFLPQMFSATPPAIIIEIGVWKGASSIVMASEMRRLNIDGVIFCVDTWLGSSEHWLHDPWFDSLSIDHGYPSLHRKFMNNVVANGLQDYILPVPLDSTNAAELFKAHDILADVIHLDAGHDYQSVASDLRGWWPRLRPGGTLIGDDYYPEIHWPGVKQAFEEFFAPMAMLPLHHEGGKCRLTKPG